jgi:vacuolar protein sorting-associated protein 72
LFTYPPFLHLPTTQLGEAVEKDQEFWNHGTWREEEEADEDYTFEDQKDIVDSDFDASEDEEDNQPVEVFKRRKKSKASSSSRYVDPALKNRTAKGAVHNKTSNKRPKKQPVPAKQRTFRSSTKAKVAESNKSRQMKEKRLKTMSAARPLKKQEEKKLTQEELLIQAAYTEVANRRSLELMLRMEDDRKKTTGPQAPYTGKRIRYTSKSGQPNILTFEQFDAIPSIINSKAPPPPKVEYCAITGMKAKYRYLHNGSYIPYATLEAYKQLRAQSK